MKKLIKILITASAYPKKKQDYSGNFYHTRNKYYVKNGIDLTVLCFTTVDDYNIDGIEVISIKTYMKRNREWNLILCHAPDRNTFNFLNRFEHVFRKIIFVIHGNEVLRINKYSTNQYEFITRKSRVSIMKQDVRDFAKLILWRYKYKRLAEKSRWIFVSNWMYEEFVKNLRLPLRYMENKYNIIYNCVGDLFEKETYNFYGEKKYDFITIRGNLDSNKYAIDIVVEIARKNPFYSFLVIGKGKYFNYNEQPPNLVYYDAVLSHEEILEHLKISRCALMPTRHDAQGVMMCEMATYGIPLITSNISVCHEVLDDFPNVFYIDNDDINLLNLYQIFNLIDKNVEKVTKFFKIYTCQKEIDLIMEEGE